MMVESGMLVEHTTIEDNGQGMVVRVCAFVLSMNCRWSEDLATWWAVACFASAWYVIGHWLYGVPEGM